MKRWVISHGKEKKKFRFEKRIASREEEMVDENEEADSINDRKVDTRKQTADNSAL